MRRLLYWIAGFLPCRLINDGAVPYLERYYLFRIFGWTFYLHRFIASDPARGLHDHPWGRAFSIVLHGFYLEQTRCGLKTVRAFNMLNGDTFHRVLIPEGPGMPKEVWTLFFHGPYVKRWGFLKPIVMQQGEDLMLWTPYTYQDRASSGREQWWLIAPKGKHSGRASK